MNPLWPVLVAALLLVAGLLVHFEILRPYARVRQSLKRLAERNFASAPLPSTAGLFKEPIRDIRKISELLQQLDRQVTDEGFSLRAILSSMVEGVLIADRSQRVRLVNDALIKLFALKESPLNRPVIEVIPRHELQKAIEAVLLEGAPREIEITFEIPSPHGGYESKHLDVHVGGLMPKPQARPMAALVVFHDVTAIRKLEARQREFLANVSHEFRTPLAIINGYVETLMDGALADPEMAQRSLKAMHKNSRRLALLIDDLLTISRLEERAKLLEFQQVDLRELLGHVLEHLEPNITERGAKLVVDWPDDAVRTEADGRRMEQVFSNLVGNALRYGEAGHLTVRISARRHENDVCIDFADNGPGIPFGDQAHIFERFYRVYKDRSRDAGGTGLGLSIVKNIVEAHGGRVSVESTPGSGATFRVCLPLSQGSVPSTGH
ncbi:MAG: ATP-binding protein [Terrimicrobiaceae bacterium]|nr:ATP-binding protein [Terrimicrobiaceae bacterium]